MTIGKMLRITVVLGVEFKERLLNKLREWRTPYATVLESASPTHGYSASGEDESKRLRLEVLADPTETVRILTDLGIQGSKSKETNQLFFDSSLDQTQEELERDKSNSDQEEKWGDYIITI